MKMVATMADDEQMWRVEWDESGLKGVATHRATGVRFYLTRSGWISVEGDPAVLARLRAEHGEARAGRMLRRLMSEACEVAGIKEDRSPAVFPDQHTTH